MAASGSPLPAAFLRLARLASGSLRAVRAAVRAAGAPSIWSLALRSSRNVPIGGERAIV